MLLKNCPPLEKVIDWVLPYEQYQNQLVDQAALMLTLSGRVTETQQVLANQTSFRLRTPDLKIEVRLTEPTAILIQLPNMMTIKTHQMIM